ncbi:MAG: beta-CASP ribonuclease aCPSF1 [Thermoplasmata archaeon]|jgi:KH/beta-lactamase-domain protein|nr:beta-CASP ribonuclease aCPSF1 [Thermoplasmata archaeon]MVT13632.1 beta-CASP ribonuclease aCPSF1 [Euryarchaeota archaeon]
MFAGEWEDILEQTKMAVLEYAPSINITSIDFEASIIVVYTKDIDFFTENPDVVKQIAQKIRRRISIRPDPSILMDENEAREEIMKIVPPEAGVSDIYFEPETCEVVIAAEAPGLVIGKEGYLLNEIKKRIKWAPKVIRTPPIPSRIVTEVREFLKENKDMRREFLREIGKKLNRPVLQGENWVRIIALGGYREVGRSATLLMTRNSRILVDCGVNVANVQGNEPWSGIPYLYVPEIWSQDAFQNENNPFKYLDAVVLTHAHIDHSGLIPFLYKYNYKGPVYLTPPTRDLAVLLQMDYIKLAHAEGNKVPYDFKDIKEMLKRTITIEYGETTDITPDVRLTFHNAGHILGSSVAHFHIGEGLHNVVITGDIKFEKTWLFSPATNRFPRAETVVIESTYGGKDNFQPTRKEASENLKNVVQDVINRRGKVLIPVFAVGRSQEVMVVLEDYMRKNEISKVPVYLDGMIWEATAIHAAYPEYLNRDLRERMFKKTDNPFLSDIFVRVDTSETREKIIDDQEPAVILATSGMMNGGPVLEYFMNLADDPKNALLFVGYQAEGTLGRKIQSGVKSVSLPRKGTMVNIDINLQVITVEGFSGHADRKQLIQYITSMSPKPNRIITCHGDNENCEYLAGTFSYKFGFNSISPRNLESIRLY